VLRLVEFFDAFMPFYGEENVLAFFDRMPASVLHSSFQNDF